jgi:adenosylcobinamide-GDP ribazoletransferase
MRRTSGVFSASIRPSSDCLRDPFEMHDEAPKVTDIRTRVRRAAGPASSAVAGDPMAPVLEPLAPALEPIATGEPTAAPPTAVAAMNTSRARITTAGGLLTASLEEIRAAFGLLTRLRIGPPDGAAVDRSGAAAFPIVGAFVAVIAMVPLVLAGVLEPLLASLLSLAMIAVVTGALHLDGLADTADALLARDHGQAERARKDPAVGPGGAIALMLVLAIEASSLAAIVSSAGVLVAAGALLVAAVVGRTTPILVIAAGRRSVPPAGFGAWFAARVRPPAVVAATLIAAGFVTFAVVATGSAGVAIGAIAGLVVGVSFGGFIVTMRRQLDGDGMGTIVELTFAAALTAVALAT